MTADARPDNEHFTAQAEPKATVEREADLALSPQELQDFTDLVSHDMRSPLINIKGFAGEIRCELEEIKIIFSSIRNNLTANQQERMQAMLSETLPEALGFIDASTNKMERQIKAILNLSRIGRREISLQRISLTDIINDIVKVLAHQLEERQTRVEISNLPDVVSDAAVLELVLDNLLANAVKYLTDDRAGWIKIYAERQSNAVVIHIQDNGCGIAPQDMDRIFNAFQRAGAARKSGEGIGLAYARTLIRRLGGDIHCDSVLDQGSTFHLLLPQ